MTYAEIKLALSREIDDDYQVFVSKGIPTSRPILGVRIPIIREIAKAVPSADIMQIIGKTPVALEEVLLRGILISRLNYTEMLKLFDSQVSIIDNWCSCDIFCSNIKPLIKKHRLDFFEQKIDSLLKSDQEFEVRVGLVLLFAYIDPDYLAVIFDRIEALKDREEYYVKMAMAWLLAECFIKYPEETLSYLKASKLPKWTFNKAISKICDSRRIDDEMKAYLKTIRK
ncbi:DNA alkylation repair protein [Candidatus Saccharibacteria bacterium]|nr:DNA alkylation repair protein [Candidatus Saccharibacteria bacterium]